MIEIIPIPAFTDNYIWAIVADGRAAIVDPGDAAPVTEFLDRRGLALVAILNTHHHADHVGGNTALLERAGVPVFGPARESIPGRTTALVEGDAIEVPGIGLRLRVFDVPGHTSGHIAYVGDDVVFCGDTLFAAGCGRLFEGTPVQMTRSLAKLAALPGTTRAYCAHEYTLSNLRFARAVEPDNAALAARELSAIATRKRGEPTVPSTIAEERATNPFLRCGEPGIRAAAEREARTVLEDPVAVFAAIREWKNRF